MTTASMMMSSVHAPGISRFRSGLWHFMALILIVVIGSFSAWEKIQFWEQPGGILLVGLTLATYLVAASGASRFTRFPTVEGIGVAVLSALGCFLALLIFIAVSRIYYSRSFLLVSFLVTAISLLLRYRFWARSLDLHLGVVPGGLANELFALRGRKWVRLDEPRISENTGRIDGVVVDFHAALSAGSEWVRVLAAATLKGIPVFHAAFVFESMTGTVSLKHLSDAQAGEFRIDALYAIIKRLIDIVFVIVTSPLVLLICLITALLIKVTSGGPVLFWNDRVGPGGQAFRMVKFRTMQVNSEANGPAMASIGDKRVTPLGRILRKYRIDELPQFWNILRGEMSLIGPRPEQIDFAAAFEKEIPFYAFRHLVKPGITGWAQVNYGYAGNAEQTRRKLEFDLFYTKYFSFSLDALVVFKTCKIILTGFGSR